MFVKTAKTAEQAESLPFAAGCSHSGAFLGKYSQVTCPRHVLNTLLVNMIHVHVTRIGAWFELVVTNGSSHGTPPCFTNSQERL